jgi:hypothetical protein
VVQSGGYGIQRSGSGIVGVATSILWANVPDLSNVPCTSVAFSLVGSVNCTAVNGNLQGDPLLAPDFRPKNTSPVLDRGPDPALYVGTPCRDLGGDLRLRDWDGDGLARVDLGAYERNNTTLAPAAVGGLLWTSASTLTWAATPSAVEYHVYRATLASLGYGAFGVCRDDLDGSRSDTVLTDGEAPAASVGFFYVIGARSVAGDGTLGFGTCVERSNFTACP